MFLLPPQQSNEELKWKLDNEQVIDSHLPIGIILVYHIYCHDLQKYNKKMSEDLRELCRSSVGLERFELCEVTILIS
jgi:hypothetical protein